MADVFDIEKVERTREPVGFRVRFDMFGRPMYQADEKLTEILLTLRYSDDPRAGTTQEIAYTPDDAMPKAGDRIMLAVVDGIDMVRLNSRERIENPRRVIILDTPLKIVLARKIKAMFPCLSKLIQESKEILT